MYWSVSVVYFCMSITLEFIDRLFLSFSHFKTNFSNSFISFKLCIIKAKRKEHIRTPYTPTPSPYTNTHTHTYIHTQYIKSGIFGIKLNINILISISLDELHVPTPIHRHEYIPNLMHNNTYTYIIYIIYHVLCI